MLYIVTESHSTQIDADNPQEARRLWEEYRESNSYFQDAGDTMSAIYMEYSVDMVDDNGEEVDDQ
jgi:hypothetical protein